MSCETEMHLQSGWSYLPVFLVLIGNGLWVTPSFGKIPKRLGVELQLQNSTDIVGNLNEVEVTQEPDLGNEEPQKSETCEPPDSENSKPAPISIVNVNRIENC